MIRFSEFYETVEMPNGMYSRSEGSEVMSVVMVIHPDDFPLLVHGKDCEQECFNAVKAEKSGLVPDFIHHVDTDLVEWAEDGHEAQADAIFDEMEKIKERDYETPLFVGIPFERGKGIETWPRAVYKPVVRRVNIAA